MEDYQLDHIQDNMHKLIRNTICNDSLLSLLYTAKLITKDECEEVRNEQTKLSQASKLYSIAMTRTNGYNILRECLKCTNQTGSLNILDQVVSRTNGSKINGNLASTFSNNTEQEKNDVSDSDTSDCGVSVSSAQDYNSQIQFYKDQKLASRFYIGRHCNRQVAVKIYKADDFDLKIIEDNLDEIKELQHENILLYFAFEQVHNSLRIALELCYTSLKDCIEKKYLPLNKFDMFIQTAKGLKYLHEKKFMHGRLCAKKILLKAGVNDSSSVVKLSCYGITKTAINNENMQTEDVFALGCIFSETVSAVSDDECNFKSNTNYSCYDHADAECNNLIFWMRDVDPDKRPSCQAVLSKLQLCLEFGVRETHIRQLENHLQEASPIFPNGSFVSASDVCLRTSFLRRKYSDTSKLSLGIDLGTYKCCVAYVDNNKVNILNTPSGNTIPSYISFEKGEVDRIVVGEEAKLYASKNPLYTVYESKRMNGLCANDAELHKLILKYEYQVKIENKQVRFYSERRSYSSEEVNACLLAICIKVAKENQAFKTKDLGLVVITIPVNYTDAQKLTTKHAAQICDLTNVELLPEPTAAAIAYQFFENIQKTKRIFVFDLGGGTFNAAIVDLSEAVINVVGYGGDTSIGGNDFDYAIYQHCVQLFIKTNDISSYCANQISPESVSLIRNECEKQKIELDKPDVNEVKVSVPRVFQDLRLNISITRTEYENITQHLVEQIFLAITNTFETTQISVDSINEVLLIGLPTRAPIIQKKVGDYFSGKNIVSKYNSEHLVAYGAALYASNFNS